MCGILGFFEKSQKNSRQQMQAAGQAMAQSLAHRGPDDGGVWQDPDLPLLLGHRRLSIIDLSPEGHQPMESSSGRYVTVYNGEIYNFLELQQELEQTGATFRGRSDTEIMLAACEKWGVNQTLQKMNGMFALALWDRKTRQLHLIRDRMGKKPLYVGWAADGTLIFASELKAFHAHPAFKPEINRDALTLYMRYVCVPAPYSIYKNVWQILPGCRMTLSLDDISPGQELESLIEPYWHHPRVVEESLYNMSSQSESTIIDDCERLLEDCVRSRMISDVPLGAFLSGGIDSSLIVALMQKISATPVKTFSIGFEEAGFDEAGHAKAVANHLGTDHHELYLKPQQAMDIIDKLPDMYDEPFADVSQIPTYLVSRFARDHVTVALSGDGGDEMFGGYVRHCAVPSFWRRVGWLPLPLRKAIMRGVMSVSPELWSKLVPHHPRFGDKLYKAAELLPKTNTEELYQHLVGQWSDPQNLVIGGKEPSIPLQQSSWEPKGLNFTERMMYGDALSYLPNDILTKVDRASMAVGLEARAPLLDKRVFEYAWSLPMKYRVRNGKGKWLLRQILARHIPRDLFERPKQGFGVPMGEWLKGPLRPWAEDLLDKNSLIADGYLDADIVRDVWQKHISGQQDHAYRLWGVLMFQSWLRQWHSASNLVETKQMGEVT